jgi:dTDP-4-dehydrorhamnose reductase
LEKLMVIGGSGLLGGHLAKYARKNYEVCATYLGHPIEILGCKVVSMDITDPQKTRDAIMEFDPDCIVLSAAQRNVDFCEKNQELVARINVEGAKNVTLAAKKAQAKLIYISTDLVFDGEKVHYLEADRTNPVNFYGETKLKGEQEVMSTLEDCAIARVSVLYDWNPFEHTKNFISWLYDNLREGEHLSLFTDQFRNATYIKNACQALLKIYEKDAKGIFHIAGRFCENRYEIGLKVAEIFGFDKSLISESNSTEGDWIAKRPAKCCLDVGKMESELGIKSMSVAEGLRTMKEERE